MENFTPFTIKVCEMALFPRDCTMLMVVAYPLVVPLTVTSAAREIDDVFAVTVTVTEPLFAPEVGDTLHQDAFEVAVHPSLLVTVMTLPAVLAAASKLNKLGVALVWEVPA